MRRLQLLYHNHFLDRPRAQIEKYTVGGSKPMIYALGNRGADLLAQVDGERRAKVDWTAKNRESGRLPSMPRWRESRKFRVSSNSRAISPSSR